MTEGGREGGGEDWHGRSVVRPTKKPTQNLMVSYVIIPTVDPEILAVDRRNRRILQSGYKAQDNGDSRNRGGL